MNTEHINHEQDTHFNAGVQHHHRQAHARANHHRHEIHHADQQILATEREFSDHCDAWDVKYRNIEGFESATFPIESLLDTARHYLLGAIAAVIITVVYGTWFSSETLTTTSPVLLFFGVVVVSIILGVVASLIVRAAFDAKPLNPVAIRRVDLTIVICGILLGLLFTLFLLSRFDTSSWIAQQVAVLVVGIEVTALVITGACDCGYRMHRWSSVIHRHHRNLLGHKATHENALSEEEATLHEMEELLHHHDDANHATAEQPRHSATAHHENGAPIHTEHHHNGQPSRPQEEHHEHIPATV